MDYQSYLQAATNDDGEAVAGYLQQGFSPNLEISDGAGGMIPLLHVVTYKGAIHSVQTLLENGANPNKLDSHGEPPIKFAILAGNKNEVQLLLDHGAYVNARFEHGETPLHVALMENRSDIVKLLEEHGANPNIKNDRGITAEQVGEFGDAKRNSWIP